MNFKACSSPELLKMIQQAITKNWISVIYEPNGNSLEYSVMIPGKRLLCLEQENMSKATEYTIYIDNDVVAHKIISSASKVFTPDEEAILYLFNLCSNRIISQQISLRATKNMQKSYS